MDFVYGAAVGVAQTLVGHPFDTLKTRRQAFPHARLTFKGMFKGVGYSMVSTCLITSNNFGLAAWVQETTGSWMAGGFFAGFLSSFVIGPLELRKVKHQVGLPKEIIRQVPLSRGLGLTIARESPAHAVYFALYHHLKDMDAHAFVAGAAAGLASWTVTYPIDVVKSRIQANPRLTLQDAIGQGHFWKGFGLAATRAIVVNGTVFWLYDWMKGE